MEIFDHPLLMVFIFMIIMAPIVIIKSNIEDKQKAKQDEADKKENVSGNPNYLYKRELRPGTIGGTNLDRFFVECVMSNCINFSKEKNVQKAKMYAERYNLDYSKGIEILYNEAYEKHIPITNKFRDKELSKILSSEKSQKNQIERYSEDFGRAKKISMLSSLASEQQRQADAFRAAQMIIATSTQQKEHSWGWAGGIAEGIAGPAAGVAAATSIQSKNAEIRAKNIANLQAAMPTIAKIGTSVGSCLMKYEEIQKEIDKTRDKLVCELTNEELVKLIKIDNASFDVSETGSIYITATVNNVKNAKIYGDVPAVVDGTFIAHIYEDQKEIGTAKLVLPINGASGKVGVQGLSLCKANPEKKHTVKYSPYNVWLIEK